jgi:UDP-3-O-[3-hydroxymyristoyl] glucosamine N-acyltransferase
MKGPAVATPLKQLAALVQGTVVGDADLMVHAARTIEDAKSGDITFLEKKRFSDPLPRSKASAAVVPVGLTSPGKSLIQVADPLMAFVAIVQHLQGKKPAPPLGVHPRALVDDSACIGDDASIHTGVVVGANSVVGKRCVLLPGVVIGRNCRIGDDVVLHPNVVLYDDVVVGDRVTVHANSVIGADGFGYRFQKGRHVKVPQLGNVVVGNDVEIGACACIDRSTFGSTVIGDGTKIDNLVQIAHNTTIGKHNALAAQVGIAGSCVTGDYVIMGGQAGVSDHKTIGAGSALGAQTGVFRDIPPGKRVWLSPAFDDAHAARISACFKRLPLMRRDLIRVLKELGLQESREEPTRDAEAA